MAVSIRRTTVVRGESDYSFQTDETIKQVIDTLALEVDSEHRDLQAKSLNVSTTRLPYGRVKVEAKLTMAKG